MKISLNRINQILKVVAESHAQVKEYIGFTEDWELNAEHSVQYPVVAAYLTPGSISIVGKSTNIGLRVAFGDRVLKGDANKDDVYSDMLQLATDFIALLRVKYRDTLRIVSDVPATPFTDFTKDESTGWYIDFIIELPNAVEICDIPLKEGAFPTPPNTTVTLKNSLGETLSVTPVLCGENNDINSPDATLTLNDQEFTNAPSGAITNIELVNEDDEPVTPVSVVGKKITIGQGVGEIPVRNTNTTFEDSATPPIYVIPDTTVVVKNTLGETVNTEDLPSAVSGNIEAPDGFARAVNEDDEPITEYALIPSNSSKDISIGNSSVFLNGDLYKSVKPQNTLGINLLDQIGNVITPTETDPDTGLVRINIERNTKIRFVFPEDVDTSAMLTIVSGVNDGNYTTATDDGSSGSITYSINGGAFAAFVNPTALVDGSTIQAKRTIGASEGFAEIGGTYE
jgi:hypothetical protein